MYQVLHVPDTVRTPYRDELRRQKRRTSIYTEIAGRATASLVTFGNSIALAGQALRWAVRDIVTGRFPFREVVTQTWFVITVTTLPAILVAIPFGVIVSVQVGSLTQQVGATSIAGAAGGLGIIQQGAPIVTALLLGGAAGSAIASDLGARTVREEIDAMETLGLNSTRRLVAPRFVAVLIVAPMLCMLIVFTGLVAGYILSVNVQGITPGSYVASFASFASSADILVALIKSVVFGLVVVTIACHRGLSTKGGPKGVATSVNATVVLGVVACFVINVFITQLTIMFVPQTIG
ncbi:MlaE family ABC transporter permease [Rhodococcus cercidiphylli]|jgi:phospholipid/cholesterol/gamma-HCH transport system permease protein|uniref:MlaE family ABC transporter permease n=1 Tax=Rhodococcus cercidiphylli TaxID=489916 RepID=UPI00374F256E